MSKKITEKQKTNALIDKELIEMKKLGFSLDWFSKKVMNLSKE